jgi:predicted NBD/HSP70 family sugar kinase
MNSRWGIDLGGTKVEGIVLSPSGDVSARLRLPTEADKGYAHILDQIVRVVDRLAGESGLPRPKSIGVGTPGTMDPSSMLMKNCNTTALNHQPLHRDLESALRCDIKLANDANCFALAEATIGSAKGCAVVFGVILGTGVGGGLVVEGKVLSGAQGIAGEWGHNVLEPDGVPCYCGKRGCVETVLSGPALERFYFERTGRRLTLAEIVARRKEDEAAAETMDRLCSKFGEALSVVVNIVDPDAIVLGGGVGNIDILYTLGRAELEKWVFNDRLATKLLKPTLGDSAGVFGAAMLTA